MLATSLSVAVQIMGLGVLQLAYMLRQGGWLCLVLMLVCAVGANYTGKLLVRCCYDEAGHRVHSSYREIGFAAFGGAGRACARTFENMTLFGVSALFLILAGKFLEELIGLFETRVWIAFAAAAVSIPVAAFRSISELNFISFIGVATVVSVVVAVVVEALMAGFGDPDRHVRTDVVVPAGLFPAFSAMALAFGCHAGLPTVEKSMRECRRFPLSFDLAFLLVLMAYLPVAVIGYAIYGDQVYSPILCSLPRTNWVQYVSKAFVAIHVILTYPVLMTLFVGELEAGLGLEPGVSAYLPKRTCLRLACVAATLGVAVFVPYFSDMMSLIGAICVVMTTFIMPAVFFIKLRAVGFAQQLLPVLVAVGGSIGGTVGAVQAAAELLHKVSTGADPNDG